MSPSVSDLTHSASPDRGGGVGRELSADALLEALDPEQRAVATTLNGPVVVMAGAGTGKTRAITHRIAYGVRTATFDPLRVLAVTFTQRAAGEMRGRLAQLGVEGVQARTFHSAALRQAKWFWPKVYGGELPPIVDRKFPLLTEAASRCRVRVDTPALRDLAGEVEWAKVSNVRPDDYARLAPRSGRTLAAFDPATIARVFAAYEDVKLERGRIDLEDVLLCAVALLAEDERVAAEIRRQYRTFVVDEYQDVSPLQQSLLDLWLGGREDVCVVGDPAQTIYSWAGAEPENLVRFASRHPSATVIKLVRDYRSTPQIVDVANKILDAAGPSGLPGRVTLRSQRPGRPGSRLPGVLGRGRRSRRGGAGDRPAAGRGDSAARHRRTVPDERAVGELRAGAGRAEDPGRAEGCRAVLRAGRDPAGRRTAAGAGEGRGRVRGPGRGGDRRAGRGRVDAGAAGRDRRGPGPVGVAECAGDDDFGLRRGESFRWSGRSDGGARPAGVDPARAAGRGGHARDAARGQGPGVGLCLHRGRARGDAADQLRPDAGAGGGGAAAVLCRRDAGEAAAPRQLVHLTFPGRAWTTRSDPLPRPASRAYGVAADRVGAVAPSGRSVRPGPGGRSPSAGSAAAACSTPAPASWAAARTARRRSTRSCTTRWSPGAPSRRRPRACPRSSSSPTPP